MSAKPATTIRLSARDATLALDAVRALASSHARAANELAFRRASRMPIEEELLERVALASQAERLSRALAAQL